jgi:enoyl-CoA hydratase/carnithine racemase
MAPPQFSTPIPHIPDEIVKVTFPVEHVVHVAMNRPKQYNAMNQVLEKTMNEVFDWFEAEPTLFVAILGSTITRAWCAGQDLKEMVRLACNLDAR